MVIEIETAAIFPPSCGSGNGNGNGNGGIKSTTPLTGNTLFFTLSPPPMPSSPSPSLCPLFLFLITHHSLYLFTFYILLCLQIQLLRIQLRLPHTTWTTQKVFHLMNFFLNAVRALVFGFHILLFLLRPKVCIWIYLWIDDNSVVEFIGKILIAAVSFMAALGFLLYGGRIILQVGSVTVICFTCFLIRCVMGFLSAFDSDASLEVLDHPILDLIYYKVVEILPSALVLYILRTLPPKRISAQYHPIH